ncbi:MAG TPA: ABC transporter ATP-binding protein [Hyphomicrobiaceae bacterium]
MASVSLRGVSKSFAGIDAVKHVTLDVAEGQFVVLLGPSGCGKTTTLRMVAGFVQPTAGHILIDGKDVVGLPPRRRNIGMVFQNYALFPNMTVAENVGFGLRERKVPRAETRARVSELLELVRLSARADAYIGELSGGQQQRVALARALAFRPQVLLMDEPLGALDLKLRESMQIELHRIQRNLGITTIMVTHDQQEAMSLADRIVIMADGEVQQTGTPEDLYRAPRSTFVADFIGKNNLLSGRVTGATGDCCTVRIADGFEIQIIASGREAVGQPIALSVRPEQLCLNAAEPSSRFNTVYGTVESRRFLGNLIYYSVRLPHGETLLVESSANTAPAEEGARVQVGWRPEAGIAFSLEADADAARPS